MHKSKILQFSLIGFNIYFGDLLVKLQKKEKPINVVFDVVQYKASYYCAFINPDENSPDSLRDCILESCFILEVKNITL